MTLASHARGPEFELRCEYSIFWVLFIFCSLVIFFKVRQNKSEIKSKKIQVQKIIKLSSSLPSVLYPGSRDICLFQFFLLKEALGMIQACIMLLSHIIHRKVWNCRIQVFSKLVESTLPHQIGDYMNLPLLTLLRFNQNCLPIKQHA